MTKDEFLNTLEHRLQLINEKERRDIIDEYRTHIEMKMKDGKTEEEAIEDFGDIDELVDEILDAYKINTEKVHQSFDRKFNDFMDGLYEGFKRFIGNFTSLETDDVVRVVFEILVILILLTILQIPFRIVSSLGASLLRNIIGFGIGYAMATVWRIIIGLAYVVVFIVLIVNVVSKRIKRYRHPKDYEDNATVFDDFKDSFHFDQAKDKMHKKGAEGVDDTMQDTENDNEKGAHTEANEDGEQEKQQKDHRFGYQSREDRLRHAHPRKDTVGESVSSVARSIMRIFFCILLIPFIAVTLTLCCALGVMIVLSFQGVTLLGAYCLVIGGLCITAAFYSLLYEILWKKG